MAPFRDGVYRPPQVSREVLCDGIEIVADRAAASETLSPLPHILDARAVSHGGRLLLAERCEGGWRRVDTACFKRGVDEIAQGLLARGFVRGDRIAIAASNSIDYASLMFAVMAIGGVAACLPATALSRPGGVEELRRLIQRVGAKAVAFDADIGSLADDLGEGRPIIRLKGELAQLRTAPTRALEAAKHAISLDDWAKLLFTSGSTGEPKGVIHTHRMLAAAQASSAQVFISDEAAANVDWLPWHHTYGGNVSLNSALWRGDALWIDAGLPTPARFAVTLANLGEVGPGVFSSVPASYHLLIDALERDQIFARAFFARLRTMSVGGAALSPDLIERLQRAAISACGVRIPFGAGYGMTETCGVSTLTYWRNEHPECIGLPPPGVTLKLIPLDEERYEVRVRGPNVTPGYLDDATATAAAFDEEGWFRTGDALAWLDRGRPDLGLRFAGRLAEDFKLDNGTFVRAGRLRSELTEALAPLARDVLIVGENQTYVGALIVPTQTGATMSEEALLNEVHTRLRAFNEGRDGATRRVVRVALFASPPDAGRGEIADKGSLNVVVSRRLRATEIAALYSDRARMG